MPVRRVAALLALAILLVPGAVRADDLSRFTIGTGIFDVLEQEEESVAFGLEWRPGQRYFDVIAPFAGGMITSDGGALGYVGFGLDFVLADRFVLMPFTGIGLYTDGDGKDLGSPVQFRSGLELGYRLDSGVQIGVSGFHVSNGGLGDENPGTEVLMLQLSVPTGRFLD
jgi:hypothetical protein